MKKIGQSKIVNLEISLLIALLLFAYVISTKSGVANSRGADNFSTLIPEKKATLKIPLNLQFDSDRYVAIGAPTTVQVSIEGAGALISAAQSRNDIQASADLRGLAPGKHTVTIALRGVNSSLTSTVDPQKITVTIAKRTTTTLPVNVTYDKNAIAKGYTVSDTSVDPKRVTISGPKTNVESVATVIARVPLQNGVKDTVTQSTRLVALDKNGNEVEVGFSQRVVNVTVNIAPEDSKKLQLNATIKNGDASQYQVTFDPKNVTAFGSSDILNAMNSISVPVDVANIQNQGTVKINLPSIDGIVRYDSPTVTANVTHNGSNTNNGGSSAKESTSSSSSSNSSSSANSSSK